MPAAVGCIWQWGMREPSLPGMEEGLLNIMRCTGIQFVKQCVRLSRKQLLSPMAVVMRTQVIFLTMVALTAPRCHHGVSVLKP